MAEKIAASAVVACGGWSVGGAEKTVRKKVAATVAMACEAAAGCCWLLQPAADCYCPLKSVADRLHRSPHSDSCRGCRRLLRLPPTLLMPSVPYQLLLVLVLPWATSLSSPRPSD